MGLKPVVKEQNGQKVLMDFVPEEAISVEGAELCNFVVQSKACPEPGSDVRKLIDANPTRSFDLHKVVDGAIVCRTTDELLASEWMNWEFNWTAPAPPPQVFEEGPTPGPKSGGE